MSGALLAEPIADNTEGWVELEDDSTVAGAEAPATAESTAADALHPPTWLVPVEARLKEILSLPENWDGRGSARPSPADVLEAFRLVMDIMGPNMPSPAIGPLSSGGVGITWRSDDLEVEAIVDHARGERAIFVSDGDDELEAPLDEAPAVFASLAHRLRY